MSKIMRQLYVEARAAREAKANPGDHRTRHAQPAANATLTSSTLKWWSLPVPNPIASAKVTIEWWMNGGAETRERLRRRAVVEPLSVRRDE